MSHGDDLPFDVQFRRLVDSRILRDNSPATLTTICTNILTNPTNPKFQSLRSRNPTIQSTLIAPLGGTDALVSLGFRKSVKEFEEVYVFSGGLEAVDVGKRILEEYLDKAKERRQREEREAERRVGEDARRREEALKQIAADREAVRDRRLRMEKK
ncbi:hypothetical protein HK104_011491, partial [Borealophlyctis nickersoniae]